jgi:methionyl-tRNA synthetase
MSNPAAIFFYDEQATRLRSSLVQQGGKQLLFSSVKNYKPPKVKNKKNTSGGANGTKKNGSRVDQKNDQAVKTEAIVYPIKDGLVKTFLTEKQKKFKQFYITTAINYANGAPHIGHAYEGITSDIIARYHQMIGRDVFFLTGSDEHGQKVAAKAASLGMTPIEVCNKYVSGFQDLNKRCNLGNDAYVRTTSEKHKLNASTLWKRCEANGDIYLDKYEGWYNIREEKFVPENEAKLNDYKDEDGTPLSKVKEESYFFRMGKYQKQLIEHYEKNLDFVLPISRRNEMLSRLKKDELRDLSASRTTFDWGIPIPNDASKKHVMYVWFDALSNYLTGVDVLLGDESKLKKYWPCNVHVIGKDILWFHSVIWPTMLMSAGIPLPKTIFAHGFVNAADGRKMSKSFGNTIDPHKCLDIVPSDTFRYYLIRETPYGADMSFSEDAMKIVHNSDLADSLGNLFSRAVAMCKRYCGGKIPDEKSEGSFDIEKIIKKVENVMETYELSKMAGAFISSVHDVNKYLTDREPWKMKDEKKRAGVVRTILESCFYFAHFFAPICPVASSKMLKTLNVGMKPLLELSIGFDNLPNGQVIGNAEVLFPKLIDEDKNKKAATGKNTKSKNKGGGGKNRKVQSDPNQNVFTQVDIRVGQIAKVWEHEGSDKLFCEEIDIGEGKPRQIASGLRKYYTLNDLQDRKVLVVCNLKKAKLAGFDSEGMVLCASIDGKTEFVDPPADAKIGENVKIDGLTGEPVGSNQMKKRKIWSKVQPGLKTNKDRIACWEGKIMMTSAGPCTAHSVVGGEIK